MTGATGFIGRHVSTAVRRAGHELTVLARDPSRAARALPEARVVEWNGTVGLPPESAFDGVDVVVNLVGESVARRWNTERKRRFRDSRVLPTQALVERMSALSTRPGAFISIAGTGYYGNRGAEVLTETAGPGQGFLAGLSQEWEAAALGAEAAGARAVVVRSGVVLGPDGGILPRILTPFRLGLAARLGDGQQYFPWIHVVDLVGLMLHVGTDGKSRGAVNGVAPEPVTNAEFTAALAGALSRPALLRVPAFALKLALGEVAEEMLLASQRVSPIRALESGYEFKFPLLAPALADVLRSDALPPVATPTQTTQGASGPLPP
ncbi:MAG: TIGR01777 family oxidoreductase [Verrucomicrobiota bacterium]